MRDLRMGSLHVRPVTPWTSSSMRSGGFTTFEVLVALSLIAITTLVAWMSTARVTAFSQTALGLIGKRPAAAQQKTARLQTEATEWVEAQLEYARQLGYQGECASASCTIYVPYTDCTGATNQSAPFSQGPAQPADFPYGRIVVGWDPNTPNDSSTTPATNYLQLVEVDIYQTQSDCQNQNPYLTGYTTVGIR